MRRKKVQIKLTTTSKKNKQQQQGAKTSAELYVDQMDKDDLEGL